MLIVFYVIGWYVSFLILSGISDVLLHAHIISKSFYDVFTPLMLLVSIPLAIGLYLTHKENKFQRDKENAEKQKKADRENALKEFERQQELNNILSSRQDTWDELERKYKN